MSRRTSLRSLMATTALGGVVSFGASLPVAAQDCGAPVDNMVRCSAAGSPYQDITYSGATDLTINVDPDVQSRSLSLTGTGTLTVAAGEGSYFQGDASAPSAISVQSGDGDVSVSADALASAAVNARGVRARGAGDVSVTLRSSDVEGDDAVGVEAASSGGAVTVNANSVNHSAGRGGAAISATAGAQARVTVVADTVRASATATGTNGPVGVSAKGGEIDIDVGRIEVSGFDASGIGVHERGGSGAATVKSLSIDADSIQISGSGARGVAVGFGSSLVNLGHSDIQVDDIEVAGGAGGVGIKAMLRGDEATLNLDIGRIHGVGSGLLVDADRSDEDQKASLRIAADEIVTSGGGIVATGSLDTEIETAYVGTTDAGAIGIIVETSGTIMVDSGQIETTGDAAVGLAAVGTGSRDVTLRSASVRTSGEEATGIAVTGYETTDRLIGSLLIESDVVVTAGAGSRGIYAYTTGITHVKSGSIDTAEGGSVGILIDSTGPVVVDSGSVQTSGDDAIGIEVENASEVEITSAMIRTDGDRAHAIAVTDAAQVYVDSGELKTGGDNARGIVVERSDVAQVSSDTIQTSGFDADGIIIGNVRSVTIESAEISTAGDASEALGVVGADDVQIKAGVITTEGEGSTGVRLFSVKEAEIELGLVRTSGALASAVLTEGEGGAYRLAAEDLTTSGANASAVVLASGAADYALNFAAVHTTGEDAYGVAAFGPAARSIALTAGRIATKGGGAIGADLRAESMDLAIQSIETAGDDATALYADAGDEADIALGSIRTAGEGADGIVLAGPSGDYALKAGVVSTTGASSRGVVLGGGESSRYDVELGDVRTIGEGATAVTTSLDGLSHNSERIALKANALTTSGENATAAYLYAKTLDVTVSETRTTGDGAFAVFLNAYGQDSADEDDLSLTGIFGSITTSGDDAEGLVVQNRGALDIAANSVETSGDDSGGLRIQSSGGGVLEVGSVKTRGAGATAVDLAAGAFGFDATFGAIETVGSDAVGLKLETGGDSALTVGTLRTSGAGSHGIEAVTEGDLKISAQDIRVTGAGADGIAARTDGDLRLVLGSVEATGTGADGIRSDADGALKLSATGKLTAAHGDAVDLTGTTVDLDLASTAVVSGGSAGLRLNTEGGATISNAGSIASTSGYAIDVANGRVSMANAGHVSGQIRLAAGDDDISNSGRWTLSGESEFGGGADLFTNTGTIDLHAGATARTVRLSGLERLDNAGSISLANGVAGDVLSVAGELHGRGANTVALDLDLRGESAVSDRIDADAFSGLSHIVLDVQGDQKLGATSVVLARSGAAQTGSEIDVSVAGGGFVGYSLALDGNDYRLTAELSNPAFEPVKIASGAQQQWTSGADTVSARLEQMRDDGDRSGRGAQVWGQAFNGSADIAQTRNFEVGETTIDADLSHEVRSRGFQAGMDREVEGGTGRLAYGLLASTGETELRFDNGDRTRFRGLGAGGYGQWTLGALALGGLAKFEHFDLEYDWAAAGLRARTDGHTFGVRLDAAWRADLTDSVFIEPQASLSWSQTSLGEIEAETGAVAFDDVRSLIGKIGLRAGANLSVGKGLMLRPYLGVHALNEFEGENAITVHLASETVALRDEASDAWGRATIGASVGGAVGLGGFLQAEQDFGSKEGFTARAGLRFAW